MAKFSVIGGATSQSDVIFIQDSSSTTGAGLSGLAFNTSGLTAYYSFAGANATATAITLATLAAVNSAWSSGGFKELDATNMKGWYRFDIPNAAIATAKGRIVGIHFQGATNMAPCAVAYEVTGWDNQDGVRGGMTALPNAAANAAGGLPISSAGALDLDEMNVDIEAIQTSTAGLTFTGAGKVDASVRDWIGGTIPAVNVTGVPLVDLKYTLGTISPAAPGLVRTDGLPSNFSALLISAGGHISNVDTLTTYTGNTVQTADVAALNNISTAQVKTQVVAALNTDTYAEPAQGTPAATTTLASKIGFLYKAWRNKATQDATTYKLFNDDAATVDHKAAVSDDAVTFTRGEVATGP